MLKTQRKYNHQLNKKLGNLFFRLFFLMFGVFLVSFTAQGKSASQEPLIYKPSHYKAHQLIPNYRYELIRTLSTPQGKKQKNNPPLTFLGLKQIEGQSLYWALSNPSITSYSEDPSFVLDGRRKTAPKFVTFTQSVPALTLSEGAPAPSYEGLLGLLSLLQTTGVGHSGANKNSSNVNKPATGSGSSAGSSSLASSMSNQKPKENAQKGQETNAPEAEASATGVATSGQGATTETIAGIPCLHCSAPDYPRDNRPIGDACTKENSYLEKPLSDLLASSHPVTKILKVDKSPSLIKPICIKEAMSHISGRFSICSKSGDSWNRRRSSTRPCASTALVEKTSKSFNNLAQCFKNHFAVDTATRKQQLENMAGMMMQESGFVPNISSQTGASGIGQFTGDAIIDLNKVISGEGFLIKNENGNLKLNQTLNCRSLKEALDNSSTQRQLTFKTSGLAKTCSTTAIDAGNPYTNMMYTFAQMAFAKEQVKKQVIENEAFSDLFSKMSANEREMLLFDMALWSHNTGINGLTSPLKELLRRNRGKKTITRQFILDNLPGYFKDRKKETGGYFKNIQNRLNTVKNNSGVGSCIN